MTIESLKHTLKWHTPLGSIYRHSLMRIGLFLLNTGRIILRHSCERCSWCGNNCAFDSSVSHKGLRCMSRGCTDMPHV